MRFGQPDVQGKDAGLGTKAEQREQEGRRRPERRQGLCAHIGKGVVTGVGLQHAETQQDGDGTDMRDENVQKSGAAGFRKTVVCRDQEKR